MKSETVGRIVLLVLLALRPASAYPEEQSTSASNEPAVTSRLFFGPTGRMLPPGHGYLAATGLLLNGEIGVTKWFSLGGGAVPFIAGTPYWLTPKLRVGTFNQTEMALSVAHAVVPGEHFRLGVVHLVSTTGTERQSFTIGAAIGYAHDSNGEGDDYTGLLPAALLGGEHRFNDRWALLSENYISRHGGLASVGVRRRTKHFALDLNGVTPFLWSEGAFFFPAVSVAWLF